MDNKEDREVINVPASTSVLPKAPRSIPMPNCKSANKDMLVLQLELDASLDEWYAIVDNIRERLSKQTSKEVIVIPKFVKLINLE